MIKSFQHKGLEKLHEAGDASGVQPAHAAKLRRQLSALAKAQGPEDMSIPGYQLHRLKKGELAGHWAISVNGNWRITFRFDGSDVELVDYCDYH